MFALSDLPVVTDIRGYGLIAGIDIASQGGKPGVRGLDATKRLWNAGLHIKFTGDSGIVAPPLVAALTVIAQTGDTTRGALALFALSIGMGMPLLAIGTSAGRLLPRAGRS